MRCTNMRPTLRHVCMVALVASELFGPRALTAQETDALQRVLGLVRPIDFSAETRLGAITPQRARTGIAGSFEWNVGSFATAIRPLLGADVFYAGLPADLGAPATRGSITSLGALAGFRVDATVDAPISPYAVSGLTGNFVWASVSNPDAKHQLQGARLGFVLGGGAAMWLGALPAAVTVDVRHVFSPQIARTSYSVGLRVQPRYRLFRKRLDSDAELLKAAVQELLRLRRIALPDIEGVVDATRGMQIALGDELFVKGTAELSKRAQNELAAIGDLLQKHPTSQIAIDLRPHVIRACANVQILRERALALRNKLIEAGVNSGRITELVDPKVDEVAPIGASGVPTECRTATITITGTQRASGAAAP